VNWDEMADEVELTTAVELATLVGMVVGCEAY
jgi:hypothetical protein